MISGIVSLTLMVLFLAAWVWAWRPARRAEFDAAARMPLEDDDRDGAEGRP
jgi:cytochrome c oxidase cbb3-type subunit 4